MPNDRLLRSILVFVAMVFWCDGLYAIANDLPWAPPGWQASYEYVPLTGLAATVCYLLWSYARHNRHRENDSIALRSLAYGFGFLAFQYMMSLINPAVQLGQDHGYMIAMSVIFSWFLGSTSYSYRAAPSAATSQPAARQATNTGTPD